MDKIIIRDLTARGVIGVYEWERQTRQEILINLILFTDITEAGTIDDITKSIDYASVAKKVQSLAESTQRYTVEALATDIAQLCLSFTGVKRVQVRVEKPGAVPFASSVGVEIVR
jgi:FolB domain-containing protein